METGDLGPDDLLPQLVARWAREQPDKTFLQEIGGRSQTYRETDGSVRRWARGFARQGIGAEDRVVAMLHPCVEMVNIWMALGWLRATHVPLNTEYQGSMLRLAIDGVDAKLIVCAERFLGVLIEVFGDLGAVTVLVLRETDAALPDVEGIVFRDLADILLDDAEPDAEPDGPRPQDLAMMMYTSGTTGASKAVMIPWGAVAHAGRRAGPYDGFAPDEVFYSMLPMFHAGFANWIHGIAAVGGTWVFRERWSTQAFWDDVSAYSCTTTFLLGAMANFLARAERMPGEADNPMRSMVSVPVPEEVDEFERRFGLEVCAVYGSTEMGIPLKTARTVDRRSCGRPFPEYEVQVVDDHDRQVPDGDVGEIVLRPRRPWISFAGYFRNPEATVGAWQNLWFHSGDLGWQDPEGNYYFVDRKKDSIRRRGENISSVEVEAYVLRIDEILECAAIPVPSEWGEDEVKVCLVLKSGRVLGPEQLIAALIADRMPRFMVPRFIGYYDELPKTPTGKVKKDELRASSESDRGWDRTLETPTARVSANSSSAQIS
jgi:crotonobetaine/carnitine-CoA ligase